LLASGASGLDQLDSRDNHTIVEQDNGNYEQLSVGLS